MRNIYIFFIFLLLFIPSLTVSSREIIEVNSFDIQSSLNDFENESSLSFIIQGINISIENKITKIILRFTEILGRDVTLNFNVPNEYLKEYSSKLITSNDVTIHVDRQESMTVFSFDLDSNQIVEISISKTVLVKQETKKMFHNFWRYNEYNVYSDGSSPKVEVEINNINSSKQIIVQYKTSFFGWYYPLDESEYYITTNGDNLKVVTNINSSTSIKVNTFQESSESLRSSIARTFIKIQIGIKKFIIDIFGNESDY